MLIKMRDMVKEKGQGIVEYALILAFVVGIGMMLSGSNLGGAVKGVFDDVAAFLGGETVALTPEEADKKKMLTLSEKLQNSFKFRKSSWGVDPDGKMVLGDDFVCVYVTKDGTADIYVRGKKDNQGWYYLNKDKSGYFTDAEKQFYDKFLDDLSLSDKSKWAPSYTGTDSQWSNGYAVLYGKNGKVSYWNMDDSLNSENFRNANSTDPGGRGVDKQWLYKAHVDNLPDSGVAENNNVGMHTRITGITD